MLFYNDDTKIFMMIFSFQIRMSVYIYACVCSFWRDIALQYSEYNSPPHGSCILKSACKEKIRVKIPFENLLGFSYRYFVSNMGAFPSLFLYAQDIVVHLHSRGRLNKKYSALNIRITYCSGNAYTMRSTGELRPTEWIHVSSRT